MKEWFRKKLVYIKRNPQVFPKLLIIIACCFFTFNLSSYSYAAVDITNTMPAVNLFITTLLSFLSILSFVSVKNSLSKKRIPVIITLVMLLILIALQIAYIIILRMEIAAYTGTVGGNASWSKTVTITSWHIVFLFVALASIVTMPWYAKLLAKIDTRRPEEIEQNNDLVEQSIAEELALLDDEMDSVKELERLDG